MTKKAVSLELLTIIGKAVKDKIYGSVEVYFEAGNITQITQRIINKVKNSQDKKLPQIRIKVNASAKKTHHQEANTYPDNGLETFN